MPMIDIPFGATPLNNINKSTYEDSGERSSTAIGLESVLDFAMDTFNQQKAKNKAAKSEMLNYALSSAGSADDVKKHKDSLLMAFGGDLGVNNVLDSVNKTYGVKHNEEGRDALKNIYSKRQEYLLGAKNQRDNIFGDMFNDETFEGRDTAELTNVLRSGIGSNGKIDTANQRHLINVLQDKFNLTPNQASSTVGTAVSRATALSDARKGTNQNFLNEIAQLQTKYGDTSVGDRFSEFGGGLDYSPYMPEGSTADAMSQVYQQNQQNEALKFVAPQNAVEEALAVAGDDDFYLSQSNRTNVTQGINKTLKDIKSRLTASADSGGAGLSQEDAQHLASFIKQNGIPRAALAAGSSQLVGNFWGDQKDFSKGAIDEIIRLYKSDPHRFTSSSLEDALGAGYGSGLNMGTQSR